MGNSIRDLDDDLVRRFNNGCEKAFHEIYNHFHEYLFLFALKITKNKCEAEDIATDILITLWNKRRNFKSGYKIRAFVSICVRNASLNYLMQVKQHQSIRDRIAQNSTSFENLTWENITKRESLLEICDVIETLPTKCKLIFINACIKEKRNREIADKMKVSVNTVRNQKVRGRDLIGRRLYQRKFTQS